MHRRNIPLKEYSRSIHDFETATGCHIIRENVEEFFKVKVENLGVELILSIGHAGNVHHAVVDTSATNVTQEAITIYSGKEERELRLIESQLELDIGTRMDKQIPLDKRSSRLTKQHNSSICKTYID